MTDESLMQDVKMGDLNQVAVLYERHKNRLLRFFLFRNYNDREQSEDCVHQVFYRVIKYRESYRDGSNFLSWVYGIAKNILLQDFKEKVQNERLSELNATENAYVLQNDDHEALHKAISLLPQAYKDVIMMSKFMGLKYEEIATICNCSEGVVKIRVFRAMKSLKENYLKIT